MISGVNDFSLFKALHYPNIVVNPFQNIYKNGLMDQLLSVIQKFFFSLFFFFGGGGGGVFFVLQTNRKRRSQEGFCPCYSQSQVIYGYHVLSL